MEVLINYFETISSLHRALFLSGSIVFFWILEGFVPLFRMNYKKIRHAGLNIFFTLTSVIVNLALAFLIVLASDWTQEKQVGVWFLLSTPVWVKILIGLMILDFISAYFTHWIQHKVKWMWKFHLIHHSDTWVDTTTANRHHPGESVIRIFFSILAVLVVGAPIWLIMIYQLVSALFSQFTHANITLWAPVDKAISWIFVSPNMHKVHHHYKQPLTDTNYGNIFSLWDRLFGTFATADPKSLTYGIDTHLKEEEHNNIPNLMNIPFQAYRRPEDLKFQKSST